MKRPDAFLTNHQPGARARSHRFSDNVSRMLLDKPIAR
jgi:hypothetical protein